MVVISQIHLISLLIAVVALTLSVILTLIRIRGSTDFRDFVVFIISIMVAIGITQIPLVNEDPLLPWITVLYINGVWWYGVEQASISRRIFTINPSTTRVFIGVILQIIASWIGLSRFNISLTTIMVLAYILLGVYKERILMKT